MPLLLGLKSDSERFALVALYKRATVSESLPSLYKKKSNMSDLLVIWANRSQKWAILYFPLFSPRALYKRPTVRELLLSLFTKDVGSNSLFFTSPLLFRSQKTIASLKKPKSEFPTLILGLQSKCSEALHQVKSKEKWNFWIGVLKQFCTTWQVSNFFRSQNHSTLMFILFHTGGQLASLNFRDHILYLIMQVGFCSCCDQVASSDWHWASHFRQHLHIGSRQECLEKAFKLA